jgi:hypothetical protein
MPLFKNNPYKTPRFAAEDIQAVAKRLTGKRVVVLVDGISEQLVSGLPCLNVEKTDLSSFSFGKIDAFIYAIDCDETGAKAISILNANAKPFYPVSRGTAKYYHVVRAAREALWAEHEADVRDGITHFNEEDFLNIAQVIDATRHLKGDYVEVGTFNGAAARFALRYMAMRDVNRKCWFFDTFTGFDYEEAKESVDNRWFGTHGSQHGMLAVQERLGVFATPDRPVNVRRLNIISGEIPDEIDKIVIANLDVDILEGIQAGLAKLAPRIVPGGILLVEDTGHTPMLIGARLALNEFLASTLAANFIPIVTTAAQTLLIRQNG